ncbi:hypothetical protein GCM10023317_88380 [Actinopolymorpha pittospori]
MVVRQVVQDEAEVSLDSPARPVGEQQGRTAAPNQYVHRAERECVSGHDATVHPHTGDRVNSPGRAGPDRQIVAMYLIAMYAICHEVDRE